MKLKNEIFVNGFIEALRKLSEEKFPIETSYKLAKLMREVEDKGTIFFALRLEIFKKYGEEISSEPELWEIKPENKKIANKEINALKEIKEDYSLKNKVKLTKDLKISPKDLLVLDNIIKL